MQPVDLVQARIASTSVLVLICVRFDDFLDLKWIDLVQIVICAQHIMHGKIMNSLLLAEQFVFFFYNKLFKKKQIQKLH